MLQFVRRQPRRDRDHDRAQRERRIEQFDDLHAIGKKQDDPVPRTDAVLPQSVSDALDSPAEIAIGKPLTAANHGDLVGMALGLGAKNGFQTHAGYLRRR